MEGKLERRVYRRELRNTLGFGETWYAVLQRRGIIPVGHRDPGGKREWFTESEARAIVERLTQAATGAAA
jgi:hypothetical protein